jgi:hypothetical protein
MSAAIIIAAWAVIRIIPKKANSSVRECVGEQSKPLQRFEPESQGVNALSGLFEGWQDIAVVVGRHGAGLLCGDLIRTSVGHNRTLRDELAHEALLAKD